MRRCRQVRGGPPGRNRRARVARLRPAPGGGRAAGTALRPRPARGRRRRDAGACRDEVLGKPGREVDHYPLVADDLHARPARGVRRSFRGVHDAPQCRACELLDLPARVQAPHHFGRPRQVCRLHLSQQPRHLAVGIDEQGFHTDSLDRLNFGSAKGWPPLEGVRRRDRRTGVRPDSWPRAEGRSGDGHIAAELGDL